jgi:site-specific recombinase XerC
MVSWPLDWHCQVNPTIGVRIFLTERRMRSSASRPVYKRTKNLRAVQILLGHTKLESTVRYLGIGVDDALEISEQTEI